MSLLYMKKILLSFPLNLPPPKKWIRFFFRFWKKRFLFYILSFFFLACQEFGLVSPSSLKNKIVLRRSVKSFTGCNPDKYPNYSRFIFQSHAPRLVSSRICKRKCVHVTVTSKGSMKRAIGGGLLDFHNFIVCCVYLMINLSKIIL